MFNKKTNIILKDLGYKKYQGLFFSLKKYKKLHNYIKFLFFFVINLKGKNNGRKQK